MFKLIKNELKKNPNYFNFIEKLEQGGGQLFEEYVVAYKKATLPSKEWITWSHWLIHDFFLFFNIIFNYVKNIF